MECELMEWEDFAKIREALIESDSGAYYFKKLSFKEKSRIKMQIQQYEEKKLKI